MDKAIPDPSRRRIRAWGAGSSFSWCWRWSRAVRTRRRVRTLTLRCVRRERVVRLDRAAARTPRSRRAADRHRVPLLPGATTRPGRRSSRSRAGRATRRPAPASSTARSSGRCCSTRSLLLVDNRGTGGSALIDCKSVQSFAGRTSGKRVRAPGGQCATEIEQQHGARRVQPVRHEVRGRRPRRGAPRAARSRRSTSTATLRHVLRAGLHRPPPGGAALGDPRLGLPAARPRPVVRVVRRRRPGRRWRRSPPARSRGSANCSPRSAREPIRRPHARRRRQRAERPRHPRALVDLVQDSASDPVILRELDASVRAALAGDNVPLLRLAGQANTWSHTPAEADYFSRGAYLAVACLDYPQLFDLDSTPEQRRRPVDRPGGAERVRAVHRRRVGYRERLHAAL